MTRKAPPANLAASVRSRLLNLARQRHVEFQLVLSGFAIERTTRVRTSSRQTQWRAFLRRGRLAAPPDANALASLLRRFLAPVLAAAARNESLPASWPPDGPWSPHSQEAR